MDYKRVLKECFWEYDFDATDIERFASSNNEKERAMLFEKILLNSTRLFSDLKIFAPEHIRELIENYKVPSFNANFAAKRKNMAEVYFLDKPITVNELKWVA